MPIIRNFPHILHGGDYNPDQWLHIPGVIDRDFELMDRAHCNAFSIAIFSWAQIEVEPDRFEFGWLDDLFERGEKTGKRYFLANASASKPAWLAERWPECRRVDKNGRREPWGLRENSCYSSPAFRERVRNISRKLAERYADHPALGGWHISNEYCGECRCDLCRGRFHQWLEQRYRTLENLNRAYWSAFWGHTFRKWEDMEPFDGSMDLARLDWRRFTSDNTLDFFKMEIAAVREFSDAPLTTNMMGFFPELDYWKFARECDFIADDCYPAWNPGDTEREAAACAMKHDLHYTMLNKPFLMMESCPGVPNYYDAPKLRRPNEFEREMLLALGHGADGTLYFQWRKGRGNCEKFHGAVVGHDGSDRTMCFRRVAEYGAKLTRLDHLVDSRKSPEAAVIYDWDSSWALEQCSIGGGEPKAYHPAVLDYYRALWNRNIELAVIDAKQDFSPYKLVVAPMLFLFREGLTESIRKFVEAGGVFVAGYFSGYVDENSCCFDGGNPGGWDGRRLFGVWNEDFDGLPPEVKQSIVWNGKHYPVRDYAEYLHLEGAEAVAAYGEEFYQGTPAVTCRKIGRGRIYYIGARTDLTFLQDFLGDIVAECGIAPVLDGLPAAVRAARRTGADGTCYFLYNLSDKETAVTLPHPFRDIWNGAEKSDQLILPVNGATILREES